MSTNIPGPDPIAPPEVCDHIIDCLAPAPLSYTYVPDSDEVDRIGTVLACTLVCRNWLPRARLHLYSTLWPTSPQSLNKLRRTLMERPFLLKLISRLVAAPPIWRSMDIPKDRCLPIVTLDLLNLGGCIKHLMITHLSWWHRTDSVASSQYCSTLGMRGGKSVVHLELMGVVFNSHPDVLLLVRSFPNLHHLSLIGVLVYEQLTERRLTQLQEKAPCWAPDTLRNLEVGGLACIPTLHLLGDGRIERFHLAAPVSDPIDQIFEHCLECISTYHSLQSLRVTVEPWIGFDAPPIGLEGEQVWRPIHDFLLALFSAVQSPRLGTLTVVLIPQQQDVAILSESGSTEGASLWDQPARYRHTREGMLDIMFAADIQEVIVSLLPGLTVFNVAICENSRGHDKQWWHSEIAKRLPNLDPTIILADVRYPAGQAYDTLWPMPVIPPTTLTIGPSAQ